MNVVVFGLWHLGSVTAACLASKGFDVTGVDPDPTVVANLQAGKAPLFEPGLDALIAAGCAAGRLRFAADPRDALADADYLWVTFDTPVDADDVADVAYVREQIGTVLPHLKAGAGVVVSSQVPVGFVRALETFATREYPEKGWVFAAVPENLRLGKALAVFADPDRIVVGTRTVADRARFQPLFQAIAPRIEWMRTESAEMTKHAINAFLATSVTFANEVAALCEVVGADAGEVARGLKTEARIGPQAYLNPGAAFAGGTLARDIAFLIQTGAERDQPSHLLRAVKASNDAHRRWAERQCLKYCGAIAGKTFALLGLTYKPGTDTLRRSAAVELGRWLAAQGGTVVAYDPKVTALPADAAGISALAPDATAAVHTAECVVVSTEWPEFRDLPAATIAQMAEKIVIDPNGFLRSRFAPFPGARYITVGRSHHAIEG